MGRMNPIHLGHEYVINRMVETHGEANCMIIIGSSNTKSGMRHFFPYSARREFIRKLYPTMRIVPAADFPLDSEWAQALTDTINAVFGADAVSAVQFYGGADDDVRYYIEAGHQAKVINRFDGTTPVISATEVRDLLVRNQPLAGFVNPKIQQDVEALFKKHWEEFKT